MKYRKGSIRNLNNQLQAPNLYQAENHEISLDHGLRNENSTELFVSIHAKDP
jgi:hypothetical protein